MKNNEVSTADCVCCTRVLHSVIRYLYLMLQISYKTSLSSSTVSLACLSSACFSIILPLNLQGYAVCDTDSPSYQLSSVTLPTKLQGYTVCGAEPPLDQPCASKSLLPTSVATRSPSGYPAATTLSITARITSVGTGRDRYAAPVPVVSRSITSKTRPTTIRRETSHTTSRT